ncbi:hypothetical protein cypCar_00045562 [Cyprinus carpio]|nr:hypothetical protein cypCar_00045562 [Cyprinus carpio]
MESRREKERQRWKLERGMTQENPSRPADLRILILGKSDVGKTATANTILSRNVFSAGAQSDTITYLRIVLLGFLTAGKSATGNTILGRNVFRASFVTTTRSCEKQEAVVYERTISIKDTPGLLDPFVFRHIKDHNESDIEKSLEMSAPGPHVFLLVIGVEGLARVDKNPVKWFQENLEKDALNHTVVLVTHADLLDALIDEPLNEYIQKIKDLKSLIDSCGGRYHTLNNMDRNNQGQVTELLEKIDEMVQRNGGRPYTRQNIFKRQDDTSGCEIQ